ncbi:MAG: hypothetical protein ACRDNB_06880 [Gaiellaceae bacterium]
MDEGKRDDPAYATPPGATPTAGETEAARESMVKGLPLLIGSVFVAVAIVAAVLLLVRYVF